jgi:hypothetical protein
MGLITQTAKEYYTVANNFTGNGSITEFTVTFDPLPLIENEFIVYQAGNEIDDDQYTYTTLAQGKLHLQLHQLMEQQYKLS